MIEVLNWVIIFLALYGAYLNSKLNVKGFLFWIITNSYLMSYNFFIGEWAQGSLFGAYLLITLNGYFTWNKKRSP